MACDPRSHRVRTAIEPATSAGRAVDRFLGTVAVVIVAPSIYSLRVADSDLWGHLGYGRWFDQYGIGGDDPFSYATAGRTWYCHEYLSQIILWRTYARFGPPGLIALKCVLAASAIFLVYRSLRLSTDDSRIWAPILMLSACLLRGYLFFRPQLFTYLFFAAFVLVLLRHLLQQGSPLWILPPSLALWANLHGGFVAGIAILGVALCLAGLRGVSERWHLAGSWRETWELGCVLVLCMVASLLNPLGWRIWSLLWIELGNTYNHRFIAEWQTARLFPPNWNGGLLLSLLVLVGLATRGAQLRGTRPGRLPPWIWMVSILPLAAMAIRSHRHAPLFVLWTAPILALLTAAAAPTSGRRGSVLLLAVTFVIVLATALPVAATMLNPLPKIRRVLHGRGAEPAGAASFLRANAFAGRIYNPLWWGSYLTWELYPRILVSCDGRNDTIYPVERIGENLFFYGTRDADLEAPLRDSADFLIAPAHSLVASRMLDDPRWAIVYEDSESSLFVRNDGAHRDLLDLARQGRLRPAVQPLDDSFE